MAVNTQQIDTTSVIDIKSSSYKPLLHELQLGEQLNECVHSTRRADFSLMLAMLAEDVREQSQFILPQAKDIEDNEVSNHALRKAFELPYQAPLSLGNMDEINLFNQAEHIQSNNIAMLTLSNVMSPKPLAFRDDVNHIDTQIMNNTSVYCQLKHEKQKSTAAQDNLVNKPLTFNANAWLNSIQKSLVKAPMITC